MPTETTATLLIGPVIRLMGEGGTMCAQTILTLDEGSRATWRIVDLDGRTSAFRSAPDAPENLLAHSLLAFLASRRGDTFHVGSNADLAPLVRRSANGGRLQTRTTPTTANALADTLGRDVAIVALIRPGSTFRPGEVAELAALGVRIELAV